MNVAILDDWLNTLRALPCFGKFNGHINTPPPSAR